MLQPDAEESSSFEPGETLEPEVDDASRGTPEELEPAWDAGRREESEPATNPWSYSEPEEPERRDEWSSSPPGGSIGPGIPGGPDIQAGYGPPPDIPNYLWQSIVATLCCCWPVGIPAIVFASRVNAFLSSGNYTGAREASEKARNWTIATVAVGLLFYVGFICMTFAADA